MNFVLPRAVEGLKADDLRVYLYLVDRLMKKRQRNKLRNAYYDGKNELHDIGYSLPPVASDINIVVGWPEKAVEVLANRIIIDGVRATSGKVPDELTRLIEENDLFQLAAQAHTSALVNSCAFIAALKVEKNGVKKNVIEVFTADNASGVWDNSRRCLSSALLVDTYDDGMETPAIIYLMSDGHVLRIERKDNTNLWHVVEDINYYTRIPCEVLAYRPDCKRPFGRSRISRAVMSYTDSAVRTFLRSELQADLYSVGSRYILGANKQMFSDENGNEVPKWKLLLDSLMVIPNNPKTGQTPSVGQFQQASFQPHIDQLRNTASMFAAATSMPPDEMGVLTDNPSSAEAIDKAQKELCLIAESCQAAFGTAWLNIIHKAVGADTSNIVLQWRNPATPSRAASADAAVKLVSAGVLPADSEVVYDMLDLNDAQRKSLRAYQAKRRAQEHIDQLRAKLAQTTPDETKAVDNGLAANSGTVQSGVRETPEVS